MIREAIAKGDTVEQAFTSACQELGVDTTEAEFEILEMPQKKTFGLLVLRSLFLATVSFIFGLVLKMIFKG